MNAVLRHPLEPETAGSRPVLQLMVLTRSREHLWQQVLSHTNWCAVVMNSEQAVRECLLTHDIPVILYEEDATEGTWREFLAWLQERRAACRFILVSERADAGTWADMLDRGGYDLLPAPIAGGELFRLVNQAWNAWKSCQPKARPQVAGANA